MKKYLITAITVSILVITGCYNDNRNATVRINLGNIPVARNVQNKTFLDRIFSLFVKDAYASYSEEMVDVIHIGVYAGDSLLVKKSINAADLLMGETSDYVDIEVPAGDNIKFLVIGEENSSVPAYAHYYGYNTVDLIAGTSITVSITMSNAAWDEIGTNGLFFNRTCEGDISWSSSGVKTKYILQQNIESWETIYESYKTDSQKYNFGDYRFIVEFEDFNLQTLPWDFSISGC